MPEVNLIIRHNDIEFEPPIEEGIKLEWDRVGSPGKLEFTTVGVNEKEYPFEEGDPLALFYDKKKVFAGYIFSKSRDKEHRVKVTCYDQTRYLKNKFSYVFENKTATEIAKSLCADFKLVTGTFEDTKYVIPAIGEENTSAMDIILKVLDETLTNTGNMFVLYDEAGALQIKNCASMVSDTLIMSNTAENFDYSTSIDDETYNQVILYYKQNDQVVQMYTASSPDSMKAWGTLRYFEEVRTPTTGQNKANALLKLYNRKSRELKVTGAFGDISVRGGTLIPVVLDLGDYQIKNYMLVNSVTHNFSDGHHTMDLTLDGDFGDKQWEVKSETLGEIPPVQEEPSGGGGGGGYGPGFGGWPTGNTDTEPEEPEYYTFNILSTWKHAKLGKIEVVWEENKTVKSLKVAAEPVWTFKCDKGSTATVTIIPGQGNNYRYSLIAGWPRKNEIKGKYLVDRTQRLVFPMDKNVILKLEWERIWHPVTVV